MACLIKLKVNEQYLTFDTIEEAREYVRKNKIEIEQSLRIDKENKTPYIHIASSKHQRMVDTIKILNNVTFDQVKTIRELMPTDDWDLGAFESTSNSHSMGKFLSNLLDEDGKHLFPRYIVNNYLSSVIQKEIARKYLAYDGITDEKSVELFIVRYFKDTLKDDPNAKKINANEWMEYLKKQLNTEELTKLNEIFSPEILNEIDLRAESQNEQNFESMIRGEILHRVFELVCTGTTIDGIKKKIFGEDGLRAKFEKRYGDKYTEVPNSLNVIKNIFEGSADAKPLSEFLNNYYQVCLKAKQQIENKFKSQKRPDGTTPEITFLTEQSITADLSEEIDGKNKIRGKLDLIVIVDGQPYIFDLKVSRTPVEQWDSSKELRVGYQMLAYQKLLASVGVSTNATSQLICLQLNDDGSIKDEITTKSPQTNGVMIERLDNLFRKVETTNSPITNELNDIESHIQKLFGVTSREGRKSLEKSSIIENLKSRKIVKSDGTISVKYFTFGVDGVTKISHEITSKTTTELEEKLQIVADKIIENLEGKYNRIFNTFLEDVQAYLTGSKSFNEFSCVGDDQKMKAQLTILLSKYKNSDAQIIHPEICKKFNILIIKSSLGIEVICCSQLDPTSAWDITRKSEGIFDSTPNGPKLNIPKNIGTVEITRAALIINELLKYTTDKLIDITCIQLSKASGYKLTQKHLQDVSEFAINFTQKHTPSISNNLLPSAFVDPLINVLYTYNQYVAQSEDIGRIGKSIKTSSIDELSRSKQEKLGQIFGGISLAQIKDLIYGKDYNDKFTTNDKLIALIALRDSLQKEFSEYFKNITKSPVVNEVTTLMYSIETAISKYQEREFITEKDISLYGFSRGAFLASSDLIAESNIRMIDSIVQTDMQHIRDKFQPWRLQCLSHVQKLKSGNGFSTARQLAVGDSTTNYLHLFRRDPKTGELENNDLIFKNPWTDESLQEHERTFLKFVLYTIHKYNPNKRQYKWKSYKDLKESHFEKTDYLSPLIRTKGLDKFRDPNGGWNFPLWSKSWREEFLRKIVNTSIDLKDTFEGQIQERTHLSDTMETMYNEFASHQNPNVREELISQNGGIQTFSMDIETMLHTFVLAQESKLIFDENTIPSIRSILYVSQFQENITGIELPNFKKFVTDYIKTTIYNDSILAPEVREMFRVIGPIRTAGATLALSYNVMNLPRELVMGFFTNISRAMFGTYGEETFTLPEYLKAWGIVTGDIPNFIKNVTKIELLNELYGISNMSITEIPEQVTSNKTGAFAMFNRFMSWTITAPDYFNRMTMTIAQMLHDGCWEAHVLEEDEDGVLNLRYDMSLDKRFNVFVEWVDKARPYTWKSGIPDDLKDTFNKQAALYEAMRDDFNEELTLSEQLDKSKFISLPRAYTTRQRTSMKSFQDMTFGYYDKETKAYFFKTSIGLIFKQFMAYLSAKKMQYFQVRSNQTARGEYKQLTDTSGNKIWTIVDDNGELHNINDVQLNTEFSQYKDHAKPKLVWTGTYMEGIVQSYCNLMKELWIGTPKALRGDMSSFKQIWREYVKKGDIRHSNLMQGLWDLAMSALFMALLRAILFDDPEVTGVSYESQLEQSGAGIQNLYWVAKSASQDFNILTSMKSLLFEWEAPSFNIIQNTAQNFWRAAGDDDLNIAEAALSGTVESVGMFRWARPYVADMLEDE